MEMTFVPLALLGAAILLLVIFFLLCAVPSVDLGKSFRCQHLADTALPDAYP